MKLELRPYQVEALARVGAAEERGVLRQLGVAATGLGKALADYEVVLTPTGWQAIGSLRVGDMVIGGDGQPTEVLGVYPQGERGLFRVTFSDGPEVVCTDDHLWTVRDKNDAHRGRPWRTIPLRDFRCSLGRAWRVPLPAPVHGTDDGVTVDPYLLGLLLGDGGLTRGTPFFTSADPDLVAAVSDTLPDGVFCDHSAAYDYRLTGRKKNTPNVLTVMLRDLGLMGCGSHEKFVPEPYLRASADARAAVLAGLLDTDGHVRASDGHIELTTVSHRLAENTAHLARSLGATARVHRHPGHYRLSFAFPPGFAPFRLARKAANVRARTKYLPARRVVKVEQLPTGFATCIKVANPDGLFIVRGYVVTHNTVMFCALAERRGGRCLVLVHRDELVRQAAAKMREVWPDARVGIVKASENDVRADVVVASVQTLARPARLAQLLAPFSADGGTLLGRAEPFGLVVVDEAHHAAADSYRSILDALRAGQPERAATPEEVDLGYELGVMPAGPLLLGVTATPDRGDGKGLDDLFDEITFNYDILWGIRAGFLADLRGLRVKVSTLDLSDVKVRRGDYDQGQAGRAMEQAGAERFVVAAYMEHALGRRTLVFTPTVDVARLVAAEFASAGISAAYVHGGTPLEERRQVLADYSAGRIEVIANCAVLTEGYDEPRTDCIIVARPTKSRALYTQMVGRGTRRHPDKLDCLVLDVVGASDDLSLVTIPSLFGLEKKYADRVASEGVAGLAQERDDELVRLGRMRAEEADLFRQMRQGGLAWVPTHREGAPKRRYTLDLGKDQPTVVLAQLDGDSWGVGLQGPDGGFRRLMVDVAMELAQGVGEDYVRKHAPDALRLLDTDAAWRNRKPSPKLLAAAKKWRVQIDPAWTAGQVSDAMNARIQQARSRPKKGAKR